MSADALLDTVLKLPAADRARIAAELIASLDGEPEAGVEAAWLVEIDQRIKDVDEGRVQLRASRRPLNKISESEPEARPTSPT